MSEQPEYTKEDAIKDDLYRWWMDVAHVEAEACAEKAAEYGSNSMTELGHEIAKLSGRKLTDAEAIELACYFYIKGKLGRWSDSIMAGKPVSDDTIGDIGVYTRMVQRVRASGDWPGWTDSPPVPPPPAPAPEVHRILSPIAVSAADLGLFGPGVVWRTCCRTHPGTDHMLDCPTLINPTSRSKMEPTLPIDFDGKDPDDDAPDFD